MTKKFIGFHNNQDMPFSQGQEITIPKGTKIKTMHPSKEDFVTKKEMKITIHHFGCGQSMNLNMFFRDYNPEYSENCELNEQIIAEWKQARESDNKEERLKSFHMAVHTRNPTVCWPGSNGYWNEVDINDLI